MRLDKYSNPIFNDQDLFDALYHGHDFDSADIIFVEEECHEVEILQEHTDPLLPIFKPINSPTLTLEDLDRSYQEQWRMPDEYQNMDIEHFLLSVCPEENRQRLFEELNEFRSRNMIDLLKWLKYFVDTCTKENIVWGVGRGSSVSSYVLYLIGVHSINPIKYNLDWQEFLR